jgi:hypothetical protein
MKQQPDNNYMVLVKYRDEKDPDYIYFWARNSDRVILSPIWRSEEDAMTWFEAVQQCMGISPSSNVEIKYDSTEVDMIEDVNSNKDSS